MAMWSGERLNSTRAGHQMLSGFESKGTDLLSYVS